MNILNLYACLGGNRALWGDEHNITSVENDPYLVELYKELYPGDTVIEGDAHEYLLNHYSEYDFIWSSPPCPSHSRARFWNTKAARIYPDLKLYEEILFLQTHFKGKYSIENVKPYYKPLIPGQEIGRHLFWTNFNIIKIEVEKDEILTAKTANNDLIKRYRGKQPKDKIIRNMVNPLIGKYILDTAFGIIQVKDNKQLELL